MNVYKINYLASTWNAFPKKRQIHCSVAESYGAADEAFREKHSTLINGGFLEITSIELISEDVAMQEKV